MKNAQTVDTDQIVDPMEAHKKAHTVAGEMQSKMWEMIYKNFPMENWMENETVLAIVEALKSTHDNGYETAKYIFGSK